MSGLDDLGRALRDDAAANAPRASAIDVDAVVRAARARRRPRLIGVGALALVGTFGLGGLAVGAFTPPALIVASETTDTGADAPAGDAQPESLGVEEDLSGGAPVHGQDRVACGQAALDDVLTAAGLRLALDLPASAPSGIDQGGTHGTDDPPLGVVRVVNVGTEPRSVLTRPSAFAVLVRDGVVVGEGAIVADVGLTAILDPGVSLDLTVPIITVDCRDGSPLPPGEYTVLVIVETRAEEGGPVTPLVTSSGPLRVR